MQTGGYRNCDGGKEEHRDTAECGHAQQCRVERMLVDRPDQNPGSSHADDGPTFRPRPSGGYSVSRTCLYSESTIRVGAVSGRRAGSVFAMNSSSCELNASYSFRWGLCPLSS